MKNHLDEPRLLAGLDFLRRTGAKSVQIRYSDDEKPIVWFAVVLYPDGRAETDASFGPVQAVLRLCERLGDGGMCTHCGRMTGFEANSLETMPANELICWYQYDPELKKIRRGCEGN